MPLTPVEPHMLAAIVTSLEMAEKPRPRIVPPMPLRLVRWKAPSLAQYRALFRRVGEPWMWFSRLVMPDAELTAIVTDPAVEVYAVADMHGLEIGMLELDFRKAGEVEIGFFGFVHELTGKGYGGWLMAQTLNLGWRKGIGRMWVHTCTLDHPAALGFYRKQGFTPFARAIETFADPRVAGLLPADAAPQIPLLVPIRR